MMLSQQQKAENFRSLHQADGSFIIPNPWDAGSARLLASLGFKALASTSAGFAFTLGQPDQTIDRSQLLEHLSVLAKATDLPVSADLENGFGASPTEVAKTFLAAAERGIVGASLEDATGNTATPLFTQDEAVARIQATAAAVHALPFAFTLTARAENYLYGQPDLADTIKRLQAYQEAGADVLYAPGLKTAEQISTVLRNIDRPLNVLAGLPGMTLTVAELTALGVKRISVGGSLARAALGALLNAATELRDQGSFDYLEQAIGTQTVNSLFSRFYASRDTA